MERLDKRFGTKAVEMGLISKEQLIAAIKRQIEGDLEGKDHRLIGQILLVGGIMSQNDIRMVLTEMGIKHE